MIGPHSRTGKWRACWADPVSLAGGRGGDEVEAQSAAECSSGSTQFYPYFTPEVSAEQPRRCCKMRSLKSQSKFRPGEERPHFRSDLEAVKRDALKKNTRVDFSTLDATLLCQSQQLASVRQEVNTVKTRWIRLIFKIIYNALLLIIVCVTSVFSSCLKQAEEVF